MEIKIRPMTIEDYDEVYALWQTIRGFAIRSVDDSRAGIARFLRRNPSTSVVAMDGTQLVGTILCGHDGRCGYFYHVCVHQDYRKEHVGEQIVDAALKALEAEEICRVNLVAFQTNAAGNAFWQRLGWNQRDVNYYDHILNPANQIHFNE